MNSNIVILVILVLLIICFSQNNTKLNLMDNSMLLFLLIFGIIIFFVYRDFNKTQESFFNNLNGIDLRNAKCNVNSHRRNNNLYKLVNPYYHSAVGSKHHLKYDKGKNYLDNQFIFAHNQSHPDCCPSTYSSDMGCVCITEDQKKLIRNGKGKY